MCNCDSRIHSFVCFVCFVRNFVTDANKNVGRSGSAKNAR